jgi:hypothetical protein
VSVAVVAVGMMEVPLDEIVYVVAMRHGLVPAARAVGVAALMTGAVMLRRAGVRVRLRYFDHMLVHVIIMRMV